MKKCHDCGVEPGALHIPGCDTERCPDCGGQYISCDCPDSLTPRLPWTGTWPGAIECREFGWWCKWVDGRGWVTCDADTAGATEDLNRLRLEAVWNKALGRFVLR